MSLDEQHVALPKLYGAPAYARPQRQIAGIPRPFDPDELPIAAVRTPEEQHVAESLPARAYVTGGAEARGESARSGGGLIPRAFNLRSIAGKLFRGDS